MKDMLLVFAHHMPWVKKIEPLPLYSAEKKVVVSLWNGNGTEDKSSM